MTYAAVHQFHSGTNVGDAVTQQMLELQRELRTLGFNSEIFAQHVGPQLHAQIRPIESYAGAGDELLLVHHSMGSDAFDYVVDLPNDIVTIYHNITPARYFSDPVMRHYIQLGHEQLQVLALRSECGVAVSNFNRREMLQVGFQRVDVLPVRTNFGSFSASRTSDELRSKDWLFIGRLVANKCQDELVAAFAEFSQSFNNHARLVLVGDTGFDPAYVELVKDRAKQLGVRDQLRLLGKVSENELMMQLASVGTFVSVSEHEGFGVPLLEAMAAGIPVVAFGAAAIPETMGGAGVLLRSKQPEIVAATVAAIQADAGLRSRLVQRQDERLEQVAAFDTAALLSRVVTAAKEGSRTRQIQIQGPFETSYSLARVNRRLAESLAQSLDQQVSIYATEGPGDYEPDEADVARFPAAAELHRRAREMPYPDVVIRQMWPPRLIDSTGAITCEYFGWEESLVPPSIVADFNSYLDGVGVFSTYVKDALRDSGVNVPIRVMGIGVDPPNEHAVCNEPELERLRAFRFLHISSAFPRKGVDVLLEAYFAGFSGSDDTSLILKTFPNPHNEVERLLAQLGDRHPDPPDVRWIDRDLDDSAVESLYTLADCYVHPARGEGFGLPVAEAMSAGIPVIATAYSGLADFVSDETATTIPFRVEPAASHLATPGSEWAEPDPLALRASMQFVAGEPDAPGIRARVDRARALISSRFSWEATATRWNDFISELEESSRVPQVAMVSTWNSRCGIADYTRYLIEAAGESIAFRIFADRHVEILDSDADRGVERTWTNRWVPDLSALDAALDWADPEIIHVQFNFAFFELEHLAELIEKHLPSRAIVVTLHRTTDPIIDGQRVSLSDISHVLREVDRIIVHQDADVQRLAAMGITANVSVIRQGTPDPAHVAGSDVRRSIGFTGKKVVGAFGFLLPHKGTLELVKVIDNLREQIPEIHLLAMCARHPDIASSEYEAVVRDEIERLGLEEHVTLITDFLPDETIRATLTAADVIVLPYRATEESSSAALRFVLPIGRPIVATDLPIFADVRSSLSLVDPGDSTALTNAVRDVLLNRALSTDLAQRATLAAQRYRWSLIAALHREIYGAVRSERRRKRRRENGIVRLPGMSLSN